MAPELESASLRRLLASLLEETAYVFTENPVGAALPEQILRARITFRGPRTGWLELSLEPPLALEVAANMLGTDPSDATAEAHAPAAAGELANIAAGLLVAEMFGTQVTCQLGIPEITGPVAPAVAAGPRAILVTPEGAWSSLEVAFDAPVGAPP